MPPTVYFNGAFVPADQPVLLPSDRGFLLGEGVYETIRVVAKRPLALAAHQARLTRHLAELGIPLAVTLAELDRIVAGLLEQNGLTDARLRLSVSAGPAEGPPSLLLTAVPHEPLPPSVYAEGVAVVTSPVP